NRVRNNQVTEEDFKLLNNRYQPGFTPPEEEKYITLSTHNNKANAINATELEKLSGKMRVFNGTVTGDFSDKALPTDMNLELKEGAQVMFIKNDSGGERKYFNGKLATIKTISADEIIVVVNSSDEELKVEKETWRNVRYSYHKETDRIEEEELGSFTQYPIRLAWAITIHKSQGLTFEKAIIDAGASFAAGQVYVALSRCTSLHGMILLSKLYPSAVATDQRVIAFAQKEAASEALQQLLQKEQQHFLASGLIKVFNWRKITAAIIEFGELIPGKKLPDVKAAISLQFSLLNKAQQQSLIAEKFQLQLEQILKQVQHTGDMAILEDRVTKGITYFIKALYEEILKPLRQHIASLQYASKVRKYVTELCSIEGFLTQQLQKIMQASYGDIIFCKEPGIYKEYLAVINLPAIDATSKKNTPVKRNSQAESLVLFKEGKSISEIAIRRQLTESTVSGHLSMFVKTGEINILELLTQETIDIILPVVKEVGGNAVSPIKEILGEDFSYADIRIVLNHWRLLQDKKVNA
ncbi:MAG: helix-turn-helix domain-containing protein, partial [Bacteroidota bacterium]